MPPNIQTFAACACSDRNRQTARNEVGRLSHTGVARSCSPFSAVKMAGLFPSAAYRHSASPKLALGRLKQCQLGSHGVAWMVSQRRETNLLFLLRWRGAYTNSTA